MKFASRFSTAVSLMIAVLASGLLLPAVVQAQGTQADYQRAQDLRNKFQGLAVNVPGPVNWIGNTHHFWYSKSVKGGTEFVLVDAETAAKKPAFDHEKLAAALSAASGNKYTALTLPFAAPVGPPAGGGRGGTGGFGGGAAGALTFTDQERAIEFGAAGFMWKCTLTDYTCTKGAALPQGGAAPGRGGRGRGGAPEDESPLTDDDLFASPAILDNDPQDGIENLSPQQGQGGGQGQAQNQGQGQGRGQAQAQQGQTQGQGQGARGAAGQAAAEQTVRTSPDGKWEALIQNFNVFLRPAGSTQPATPLSYDGSEGNYYTLRSIVWSPDSKKLVAYHTRPGYRREVHYVESSPTDQLQPKHSVNVYAKPGDALDIAYPALFDMATKKETAIGNDLFPNAYDITTAVWRKDGRGFTFEYNQRGHQVYRVIEVDAQTGQARALITEKSATFIDYRPLTQGLTDTGKKYRYDVSDGKEIIWASERDGWEHLYLYDGVTGAVKNQITKGNWVVRFVDRVDEEKRQIWFRAAGMNPGQDPYFTHYYRISFDGTGLTRFTDADGNHTAALSPDRQYYVDSWSRVDMPTVAQLRRTEDQKVVMDVERGDASALVAAGFKMPEVFVAKGRDGKTDIWGVIFRPTNFDPSKKYPVIESIYAGPQGSFVPKAWSGNSQALTELGFIVVQIDGMGTNSRSKAFHDVAWKNLGDAGLPDRILWHKAVAAKYPWYDISRVGVYGNSAGGQNAMGALLFHPEFYKVAVSNSGCHDNRMDKIWWNEQWMGWPLGPEYSASSNVDNADRLQGKLLLIVGEMDTNVDPASTLQVVNALLKGNKKFDMLFVPGVNHGTPGLSQHFLQDYFVHNLLGVEPPDWNRLPAQADRGPERGPGN
jgi:dipeptidyl aminopeptidase/acylaminoacyl peptidase